MYRVEGLDWEAGLARVRAVEVDYYTRASAATEVRVLDVLERRALAGWEAAWGTVEVTSRVTGYRQIRRYTHEVLGWGRWTCRSSAWRRWGSG